MFWVMEFKRRALRVTSDWGMGLMERMSVMECLEKSWRKRQSRPGKLEGVISSSRRWKFWISKVYG